MKNDPAQGKNRQRGSSLIEYALVLTVLLLFIFGIIDFARAVYAYHFVANAAREATRYAMVRSSTCNLLPSPVPQCPADQTIISNYVSGMATGIGLNNANSIQTTFTVQNPPSGTSPVCTAGAAPPVPKGCTAQVTVQYPFNFILPLMPKGTSPCGQGVTASICMTSTSAMVVTE